jgi:hypothetical protein
MAAVCQAHGEVLAYDLAGYFGRLVIDPGKVANFTQEAGNGGDIGDLRGADDKRHGVFSRASFEVKLSTGIPNRSKECDYRLSYQPLMRKKPSLRY